MLIKNNKIIVRKCTKETSELIFKSGFRLFTQEGKTLIVPFYVFNEKDLCSLLNNLGIKFYAVPLNGHDEGNVLAIITNKGKLLNTYNTICKSFEDSFVEDNNFTLTIGLIQRLSTNFEKNVKQTTYENLITCLNHVIKNPIFDNIDTNLAVIGDIFNKFVSDKLHCDSEYVDEVIETIIITLRNNLNIQGIPADTLRGSEFIRVCLDKFVIENLRQTYNSADFVFWYNCLNEIHQKNFN